MLADAIQWILEHHFTISAYLDNFFFAGAPNTSQCVDSLNTMLSLCSILGVPIKQEKVEGPTTTMSFLGIELDTRAQQARLAHDKLVEILQKLRWFADKHTHRTTSSKCDLLSLISKLVFACKVVPAGRIFLRCLLDLAHSVQHLHQCIHITNDALLDIQWWLDFSRDWNGKAFFIDPDWTPASHLHIFMDASSTLGYGAYWNGAWFSQP